MNTRTCLLRTPFFFFFLLIQQAILSIIYRNKHIFNHWIAEFEWSYPQTSASVDFQVRPQKYRESSFSGIWMTLRKAYCLMLFFFFFLLLYATLQCYSYLRFTHRLWIRVRTALNMARKDWYPPYREHTTLQRRYDTFYLGFPFKELLYK